MISKSLLFIVILSLAIGSLEDEYNERLSFSPPEFTILFDFSKSQKDLVKHFTENMWKIAGRESDLGVTLSDVLFNFFTYDPFSRRSGKEISEEHFIQQLESQLKVIATSTNDEDIDLRKNMIMQNISGMIKSTQSFSFPKMFDAKKKIITSLESKDLGQKNKETLLNLLDFLTKTIPEEQKLCENLKVLQELSKKLVDGFIYTLVLATFQPNLEPRTKQIIRLRILELAEVQKILTYYENLSKQDIDKRNNNLMKPISDAKNQFNQEFINRNNGQANPLNDLEIEKIIKEEVDFLELLTPKKKDQMKKELERLRNELQ